jgi:uncharacterized protein (DUF736 family)
MYEQKELQGSCFPNDKKGNDKAPDFKGKCLINGQLYYLAGWNKTSKQGERYSSLKFSLPKQKEATK